jgi:hypothetical protein
MPDLLRRTAELRDTVAEVIAESNRACERARLLVRESAGQRAGRKALRAVSLRGLTGVGPE